MLILAAFTLFEKIIEKLWPALNLSKYSSVVSFTY